MYSVARPDLILAFLSFQQKSPQVIVLDAWLRKMNFWVRGSNRGDGERHTAAAGQGLARHLLPGSLVPDVTMTHTCKFNSI